MKNSRFAQSKNPTSGKPVKKVLGILGTLFLISIFSEFINVTQYSFAVNMTTTTVTSTYTEYVGPNMSQITFYVIPYLYIFLGVSIMIVVAKILSFDADSYVFSILLGIVIGSLLGVLANSVPLSFLVVFGAIFALYIWRARAENRPIIVNGGTG